MTNDIFYRDILLDQGHGIMSHTRHLAQPQKQAISKLAGIYKIFDLWLNHCVINRMEVGVGSAFLLRNHVQIGEKISRFMSILMYSTSVLSMIYIIYSGSSTTTINSVCPWKVCRTRDLSERNQNQNMKREKSYQNE